MKQVVPIFKREFFGYFRSPVGYVVLAALVILVNIAWFFFDRGFFEFQTASLATMFGWMPWIFCLFVPAVAMRLWAEERRSGSIELLLTLPVTTTEAVLGKFLAAWAFIALGIALTFPAVITVAYLGNPDWGTIFTGYFGTFLMASSFIGICTLTSACTRNQVISFIISLIICLVLAFLGTSMFSDFLGGYAPVALVDAISNFSFTTHFRSMSLGLVDVSGVIYFISLSVVTLIANVVVLER